MLETLKHRLLALEQRLTPKNPVLVTTLRIAGAHDDLIEINGQSFSRLQGESAHMHKKRALATAEASGVAAVITVHTYRLPSHPEG